MNINPISAYNYKNYLPFTGQTLQKIPNRTTSEPRETMTPEITNAEFVSEDKEDKPYRKSIFPLTKIKRAWYITAEGKDETIKKNRDGSYTVNEDTQTKAYYGKPALKFLKSGNFEHDTQIMFPKDCHGTMIKDGKEIPLPQDSAVQITAGTKGVKIVFDRDSAYPFIITTEKDFSWYDRHDRDSKNANIRNKYIELTYFASAVYNAKFTPNLMLSGRLKNDDYLRSLGISKWDEQNNLVETLFKNSDKLTDDERREVVFVKGIKDKLIKTGLAEEDENKYLRIKTRYTEYKQRDELRRNGFTEPEIEKVLPFLMRARQARMDSAYSRKNAAAPYGEKNVEKMKQAGIIVNNKKDTDHIYWKDLLGNEKQVRDALLGAKDKDGNTISFSEADIDEIIYAWKSENITGYDMSGLKYIDEDLAVYNLADRINNWTQEETNWATNSTATSSTKMNTPSVGISVVRYDKKNVVSMNKLRIGEVLHQHPNQDNLKQYEVYFITHGKEVLDTKKITENKKELTREVVLKPGDLAIIKPSVKHCVNVVKGEVSENGGKYEHICFQIPSAFHFGLGLKRPADDGENARSKFERGRTAINKRYVGKNFNRLS